MPRLQDACRGAATRAGQRKPTRHALELGAKAARPLRLPQNAALIYGLFASLMLANLANLLVGNLGLRFFTLFLAFPRPIILAVATLLCVTGAYLSTGSLFGSASCCARRGVR